MHPAGGFGARALRPRGLCGPVAQRVAELFQAHAGVCHQAGAAPFARVEMLHIEAEQARPGKQGVRARGEVLQPGAHCKHYVGFAGQQVGGRAAVHADGAQIQWMVPGQGTLAAV